jgi:hypothetical protein
MKGVVVLACWDFIVVVGGGGAVGAVGEEGEEVGICTGGEGAVSLMLVNA